MRLIFCLVITMLIMTTVAWGQNIAAPQKTDSTFVTKVGDADAGDLGADIKAGKSIKFTIKIDRVVGSTTSVGALESPGTLINNGIIAPYVTVKLLAYDIDRDYEERPECSPREFDQILINGYDIGKNGEPVYLNGKNKAWRTNSFDVPISIIRFGIYDRVSGQWLGSGENQFEIKISTKTASYPSGTYPCNPPEPDVQWSAKVKWAAISFKAMYPVIMVHGTESSGAFFTNNNFIDPFNRSYILYDNSINLDTNLIDIHGNRLAIEIPRIAKERFHVKHVHIVAHSQGGIDTRDFLARTMPKGDLSVLSLITLATPHHGSPGADYAEDSAKAAVPGSSNKTRVLAAQARGTTAATPNLRVAYMEKDFNPTNDPKLPDSLSVDGRSSPVQYFALAGNADGNGNGMIDVAESQGMDPFTHYYVSPQIVVATLLWRLVGEVDRTTLEDKDFPSPDDPSGTITITLKVVKEVPNKVFLPNDIIVSVKSAQHAKFTFLGERNGHNHSFMGKDDIATEVIAKIRSINP